MNSTFSSSAPTIQPAASWRSASMNRWGARQIPRLQRGQQSARRRTSDHAPVLKELKYETEGLRSKDWNEFAQPDSPPLDFVFTLCDRAAAEVCPTWPGQPIRAHWGVQDPVAVAGSSAAEAQSVPQSLYRAGATHQDLHRSPDRDARTFRTRALGYRNRQIESGGVMGTESSHACTRWN